MTTLAGSEADSLDLSALHGRRNRDHEPLTIESKRVPGTPDVEPAMIDAEPNATSGESEGWRSTGLTTRTARKEIQELLDQARRLWEFDPEARH